MSNRKELTFGAGLWMFGQFVDRYATDAYGDWKSNLRAIALGLEALRAVDRYGLAPEDLLFDPLVLPISTGMEESRRDGIETIEGIRRIKEALPGVGTLVGLSNVSFGLSPAAPPAKNDTPKS